MKKVMDRRILNNIELYYTPSGMRDNNILRIEGEELNHILKVMRHKKGDELYITDGEGCIFKTYITNISSHSVETVISDEFNYENKTRNLYFCIPKLKSTDRFETALEKCTELGITNFIIYESERTIAKSSKMERWEKIVISAMKQSLRSFVPRINVVESLNEIIMQNGNKILFLQEAEKMFTTDAINGSRDNYFIFGPEGDFTENEKKLFDKAEFYNLGDSRLRSETAIIKCASIIS